MQIPWRYPFILIILIGCASVIQAQLNQTERFTSNDGLTLTECGDCFIDRAGMIWVQHSTGGLTRFDGHSFVRFSPEQIGSHADGSCFLEDHYGLWVLRNRNSLSLFKNGIWSHWEVKDQQRLILDKEKDQMILQSFSGQLLEFDPLTRSMRQIGSLPKKELQELYEIRASITSNEYLLNIVSNPQGLENTKKWVHQKAYVSKSLRDPLWLEEPKLIHPEPDWTFYHLGPDQLKELNILLPASSQIHSNELLHYSQESLLYATTQRNPGKAGFIINVYKIDKQSFLHLATMQNGDQNVSVELDQTGNIWVSSLSGLTRVSTSVLECFEYESAMVPSMHVINEDEQGRIWFGGYTTGLCYFLDNQIFSSPSGAKTYRSFLPGSYRDKKGTMAFWTEDFDLILYNRGQWKDAKSLHGTSGREVGYYFLQLQNGKIAAGFQNFGLGITDPPLTVQSKWNFIGKDKGMLLDNVLTITEDSLHRLWLGRKSQGVSLYDPQSDTAQTWLLKPGTSFNYGMMSSAIDHRGRLWMGCSDGLKIFEKPSSFRMFQDDFPSNVHQIQMGEAGYSQIDFLTIYHQFLVFGNSLGYGFLDLNSYRDTSPIPRIFFFPTAKFGMSSEQNAVLLDSKGYLWIGQDKGAIRVDMKSLLLDSLPVEFKIVSITARGEKNDSTLLQVTDEKVIRLPFKKRNITLHVAPTFTGRLNDNVFIQYSFLEDKAKDTLWSPISKNYNIRIDILPSGRNTIFLRCIKNNRIVNQSEFQIYVPPKLTETFMFWFSLFALFCSGGFLITRHVFRQRLQLRLAQINLAERNREKNQFQISAIANALNPHFIKNTLAWMQSRFRKDDQVVDVIDRLAFNIGSVFLHSRKGEVFHTLEEELKVLENFLSIQLAIYGPFIDITLPEEKDWKPWREVLVPLLQIQIHAENAIEHGLRNKPKGEKKLHISVSERDPHYIEVRVEDNGIGRAAAKERGSRGTRQGTVMLDRVYELYNQQNDDAFQTIVEDLYDVPYGNATGTRVIIIIPKKYKLDLS